MSSIERAIIRWAASWVRAGAAERDRGSQQELHYHDPAHNRRRRTKRGKADRVLGATNELTIRSGSAGKKQQHHWVVSDCGIVYRGVAEQVRWRSRSKGSWRQLVWIAAIGNATVASLSFALAWSNSSCSCAAADDRKRAFADEDREESDHVREEEDLRLVKGYLSDGPSAETEDGDENSPPVRWYLRKEGSNDCWRIRAGVGGAWCGFHSSYLHGSEEIDSGNACASTAPPKETRCRAQQQ